ncbi:MAG: hypothetical protein SWX82_07535 [Cyanobacteriota bacterium]|nr:hypothetical protein [Cyanobacteriota bacterium]
MPEVGANGIRPLCREAHYMSFPHYSDRLTLRLSDRPISSLKN